jgi:hypothetical protein
MKYIKTNEEIFNLKLNKNKKIYLHKISSLIKELDSCKVRYIDWDMTNCAIDILRNFNKLIVDMKDDNKFQKYLKKMDLHLEFKNIERNVEVNNYGINREDGLYLGNIGGLFTNKVDFWINSDDKDAKEIVSNQLYNWLSANLNKALRLFNYKVEESKDNIWEQAYLNTKTIEVQTKVGKAFIKVCKECGRPTDIEETEHRQVIGNVTQTIVKCLECGKYFVMDEHNRSTYDYMKNKDSKN